MEEVWNRAKTDCRSSTVLLVDTSCNTKGITLDNIKGAVTRFVFMSQKANKQCGFSSDNFALVSFANVAHIESSFTTNYRQLINKVDKINRREGKSADLQEGLLCAIDLCNKAKNSHSRGLQPRIILFTSGENHSQHDPREVAKICLRESIRLSIVECDKKHCNKDQRRLLLDISRLSGSNSICEDDSIHTLFQNELMPPNFSQMTSTETDSEDTISDCDSDYMDTSNSEEIKIEKLRANLSLMIPNISSSKNTTQDGYDSIESSSISYERT